MLLLALVVAAPATAAAPILPPSQLRVDHLPPSGSGGSSSALGPLTVLQHATPSFSWALRHRRRAARQAAFRLVLNATSHAGGGSGGRGRIVWDSGVVVSAQSVGVVAVQQQQQQRRRRQQHGGTPLLLTSDTDYVWTVAWQDELGAWSGPSVPARFSTGLLAAGNADWDGTAWVGGLDEADDRNQLRRVFSLPPNTTVVRRGRCYVAAPGGHETYLNGVRLHSSAAAVLEGAALGPTVQFSSKLPYQTFDCTETLRAGGAENVLATTLGRGWFAMPHYGGLGYSTIGARSLRVLVTAELVSRSPTQTPGQLTPGRGPTTTTMRWRLLDDVRRGSPSEWKQQRGPVVRDHLFLGLVQDGRRETAGWRSPGYDDSSWADVKALHDTTSAEAQTSPPPNTGSRRRRRSTVAGGRHPVADPGPLLSATVPAPPPLPPLLALTARSPPLVALSIPPIRRRAPRVPVSVRATSPGVALLDLGINMAGTCEIVVDDTSAAQPGDIMSMRHAEGLGRSGSLDQNWLTGEPEHSAYVFRADGTREVFSEKFVYFGFRYLEITGFPGRVTPPPGAVTCWFTHTDLERDGSVDFLPSSSHGGGGGGGNASAAPQLNQLQAAITQSALSNFHSHPTDCPSREVGAVPGAMSHVSAGLCADWRGK
jgi:alpha-L-rhamnosidase